MVLFRSLILASLALACLGSVNAQQKNKEKEKYFVYDGAKYQGGELAIAMKTPVEIIPPRSGEGGVYSLPRAYDGHFYLPGNINGFPVVFMVDTGASVTAIPVAIAKNSGIRAGVAREVSGSGGKATGGLSQNNKIVVGRYSLSGVQVLVSQTLTSPLLGADVLSRFQIRQTAEALELRPLKKPDQDQMDTEKVANSDE